jgi:glycosyltransferase involved in cell wall biosynthesis
MSDPLVSTSGRAPARVIPWRPRAGTTQGASAMRPIRVLFAIDELDIGGTEQQIVELVRGIDRAAFAPQVVCFRSGAKAKEIASLGIPVRHEAKWLKADPGLVMRLAAFMKRERFDLVQTYLWGANTWGRLAARLAGVRCVVASERNVDIWEEAYKRLLGRWLARSTDRIVANSEAVRRYLLERGGLSPEKVLTIYNGVNLDRFKKACDPEVRRRELGIPEDAILAGCVARLEPAKDHATLLQALALLGRRRANLHLVVIGDGSQRADLGRLANELGLRDRVHFTGFRTDSAEWLQSLDLSVLSSVKEGLSNTVIESMAAGRAVVATDVGGNAEVIREGETGFLVPARQPAALAEAIAAATESAEMLRRLGHAGRERVESLFSVRAMVRRTEQLYRELLLGDARAAA